MKALIAEEVSPEFTKQIESLKRDGMFTPMSVSILATLYARKYLGMGGATEKEIESYFIANQLFTEAVQIAALTGTLK